MVKKNEFDGVVRVEFESAKATEVACLSLTECVMEIRHDAECRENRHNLIEDGTITVREGERLVIVMAQSYVKSGVIDESECEEVRTLYRMARRYRQDRLRVKIYASDDYNYDASTAPVVGYAWIGKGKGIADTDKEDADNDANEVTACVLSAIVGDWGFIGMSINCATPKSTDAEGNSNEYRAYSEWKIAVKSDKKVDAEIANFLSELALKYPNAFDVSRTSNCK